MKIIFLDIDGVLNDTQTFIDMHDEWLKTGKRRVEINEKYVERLSRIVKETGAKIVLSSTWRSDWKHNPPIGKGRAAQDIFDQYGISIYGITPSVCMDNRSWRSAEIIKWINDQHEEEIESYCIIDDDIFDLMELEEFVIKTSFGNSIGEVPVDISKTGLQEEHVQKAIDLLNKN